MEDKKEKFSVQDAKDLYSFYKSEWEKNYTEAQIDLLMYTGDKATHWGNGWDANYDGISDNRPQIVINELPQFIHQVCNDIRQNTPSIKVIPDYDSSEETADVISELIRAIEYKSKADCVYDTAAEYAASCGIGFIRIDHEYEKSEGEEQEVVIKRVTNPLTTWIDPNSVECDGSDAMGAMTVASISKKDFELLYPKKEFISFDTAGDDVKDTIKIAEIFVREWNDDRMKSATVRRYKVSGAGILEETIFPSMYVPIIPIYGKETWIEGKRILQSLIRQARDPQRRLNYLASKEAEIFKLAPVAPFVGAEGTFVNERGQWNDPGSETFLEYRQMDIEGNPAPAPQRLAPPPVPTGIVNAIKQAKENIKEVLGLYNASIGQKSNETSGVAINARKLEGDTATLHFADNLRRGVTHTGCVIVDMIAQVYDTARVVQIVNVEEQPKSVGVNGGEMQEEQKVNYNLTDGKYHVRVTTGSSYTTKRQEEAQFLSEMFKQSPELMAIGGDLLFKSLDLPGAEALSERFKKTIDPKLLQDDENIPPEVQQMQAAMQQMQEQLQQMGQELQSKQGEEAIKQGELQIKQGELHLKEMELQLKAQEMQQPQQEVDKSFEANQQLFDQQIKERETAIKEREMELKEAEFKLKVTQAMHSTNMENIQQEDEQNTLPEEGEDSNQSEIE